MIGLGIYAVLLYAALLIFNVTLTLPGFAGLILTIGVAADANVVVFERIKEEVRAGKSVRAAISTGYSKGFHTIIDANVVTAITALVLFLVATAGVKGFALMLLIGTAISLVTAVFATRAMLGLLAGFRWFENPAFMGAKGQQHGRWLQIDFMGKRRLWFAISGVVVAIAIVSLGVRGLNLGIDFKGGSQVTFQTPQPQLVDDVRSDAQSIDSSLSKAVIQGRGASTDGKYKSFQLRTKALSPAVGEKLRTELETKLGATHYGSTTVSESFGRQIAKSALWAIFGSLLLIVLYLAIRFDYKYAIPVLAALIHDIVITVGVYSLTGREVTTATVAAVLTVLGYSIYDTIIIFDRIRENVPLMRRASFATIANISLWETIRRSLATTFITLLPVASLFIFGGATLKDFAFALLIGIGSGAYSSIFIAAPLLTILKEREPEWAAKKGLAPADGDSVAMRGGARSGRSRGGRGAGARARPGARALRSTAGMGTASSRRHSRSGSGGGSVVAPGRMAADNGSFVMEALERVGLAAIGAVALTAERADALADELSQTGGIRRDEAREVIEQTIHRWRGEAVRFTERAGAGLDGFFQQLGLVPRSDFEELELRVAQLEHRLRLVEDEPPQRR